MRRDDWLLCFLIFCHNKRCTDGIDILKLEEIIRGVAVSDDEGSSIDIDDDHKQKNPECGYLPEKTTNPSANLVSIPDQTTNNFLLNTLPSITDHTEEMCSVRRSIH